MTILRRPKLSFPSLHNPEHATARIAKTIALDLNDSRLLFDYLHDIPTVRSNLDRFDKKVSGFGAFSKSFNQRCNISNDDAYDLLKENHQNKIRSTLGNPAVDHALPAVRLQWPFVSILCVAVYQWMLLSPHSIRPSSRNKKLDCSTAHPLKLIVTNRSFLISHMSSKED